MLRQLKDRPKETSNEDGQEAPRTVERRVKPGRKAVDVRSPKKSARKRKKRLKPERVQLGLRADQLNEALRTLPNWRALSFQRALERTWTFPTAGIAGLYAAFVAALAEEVGQHCAIEQDRQQIKVALFGRRRNGTDVITRAAVDFARRLG